MLTGAGEFHEEESPRTLLLTRGLSVGIANGTWPSTDVVIVNYDVLKKWDHEIKAIEWDALIPDECHKIKNDTAQRTRLVFGHTDKKDAKKNIAPIRARRRIFLTGTPIVNRPKELWTLVSSLDPDGLGRNFFAFAKRYCDAKQTRFGWDFSGASNLPELQDKLRERFMVRRLKADVLKDLPAKTRQTIALPVPPSAAHLINTQRERFEALEDEIDALETARDIAEETGDEEARAVAVEALKAARGVMFEEMARMRHDVAIAKAPIVAEYVKDWFEDQDDRKLILFAHHRDVIDLLMTELAEFNPVKVTGDVTMTARQAAVDRFQSDPSCRLFVGNIAAAGVGLTLTAAQTVAFAELDWTPAGMSQAEDRAHRIGQQGNVHILHLVFDGSLDATISKRLVAKQAIIDKALDNPTAAKTVTESVSSVEIADASERPATDLSQETIALIHHGIRVLAGRDEDHAMFENGIGFNGRDSRYGHSLADQSALSQKQAAIALKMCRLYKRQLAGIMVWGEDGLPHGV